MQGVNNPGFQLLSLSNSKGHLSPDFQSVPVILPNQLTIFITYGVALIITLIIIFAANFIKATRSDTLLPTHSKRPSDDFKNQKWKMAKNKRLRRTVLLSGTDLRKIGVWGVIWYLWLIWY
jgi:hypothetical protein